MQEGMTFGVDTPEPSNTSEVELRLPSDPAEFAAMLQDVVEGIGECIVDPTEALRILRSCVRQARTLPTAEHEVSCSASCGLAGACRTYRGTHPPPRTITRGSDHPCGV